MGNLGSRELVNDPNDSCWTSIDVEDVVEVEVAHESRAHHILRAYLAWDEHHRLCVERHHLSVLVLAYDGEEVEHFTDMAFARGGEKFRRKVEPV